MDAQSWAALITALGVGAVLPEIVKAIIRGVSGRVGREQSAVEYERKNARSADERALVEQKRADAAEEATDREIVRRRAAEGYAAHLERVLIRNGIPLDELTQPSIKLPRPSGERKEGR